MKKTRVNLQNAQLVSRGDYMKTLSKIQDEKICPFCEKHFLTHHTKPILFKNRGWLVTKNAWPYAGSRYHFLLVARRHIEDSAKLTAKEWEQLGAAQRKLVRDYKLPASTLVMRSGDTRYTGATVTHLHAQLVLGDRKRSDSEGLLVLSGFKK